MTTMRSSRREKSAHRSHPEPETVKVLVGKEQHEFVLKRKPLAACSVFFRDSLATIPTAPLPSPPSSGSSLSSGGRTEDEEEGDTEQVLWLPTESPEVFELFVLWLYRRPKFNTFINRAVQSVSSPSLSHSSSRHPNNPNTTNPQNDTHRRALRWNLVRLHLFAELIDLPVLQDTAIDALQDMYLRCDWAVSPGFLIYLYRDCPPHTALRLRRWAVAMLAWTLHSAGDDRSHNATGHFDRLFAVYPAMSDDYRSHLAKMAESSADVRIKNPQLRLPLNRLRNEERHFGFRQCSFHSHRAVVGEGMCPHVFAQSPLTRTGSSRSRSPRTQQQMMQRPGVVKEEPEEEEEEEEEIKDLLIKPVADLSETSFLDLS